MKRALLLSILLLGISAAMTGCKKDKEVEEGSDLPISGIYVEGEDGEPNYLPYDSFSVNKTQDDIPVVTIDNVAEWENHEFTEEEKEKKNELYEATDFTESEYNNAELYGMCAAKDGWAFLNDFPEYDIQIDGRLIGVDGALYKYLSEHTDKTGWQLSYIPSSFDNPGGSFVNWHMSVDNVDGYAVRIYYCLLDGRWTIRETSPFYSTRYPGTGK